MLTEIAAPRLLLAGAPQQSYYERLQSMLFALLCLVIAFTCAVMSRVFWIQADVLTPGFGAYSSISAGAANASMHNTIL